METESANETAEPETKRGSLTVVGTGIRSVAHLTMEAKARIEWADQVLVLVADGVTTSYVRDLNPSTEDLHVYYGQDKRRNSTYEQMRDRILYHVRNGKNTCLVMYGHPGVFVNPSHAAMRIAAEEGYPTEMQAGISAEDCLYADLGLDPATHGCQMYEATFFLARNVTIDRNVPLIVWQVGCVGDSGYNRSGYDSRNLPILIERLQDLYSEDHTIVIHEAAQHPLADTRIWTMKLSELKPEHVTGISTMFVPPFEPAPYDLEMIRRLKQNATDLRD